MMPDPYRTPAPAPPEPDRERRSPFASYDMVFAAALAWGLGLIRVVCALQRHETPNRELDFAWLLVFLVPILLWKEIAAQRGR